MLGLTADGQSNVDIALALTFTDAVVSKHIGIIFAKLGLGPVEANAK